ncbi:hypothetical protein P3T76_011422 [Phytophthora citrophthora]|uniref:Uncharacterized protein n=1 Tax=Phytophthora citrophthora TaxID=4793 RepID=A0AAD9G983_9STRA|nr:hypothetical protein P3T76_011422 [Phytophthora citrophthora]
MVEKATQSVTTTQRTLTLEALGEVATSTQDIMDIIMEAMTEGMMEDTTEAIVEMVEAMEEAATVEGINLPPS